ncbi:MAG TPA: hypothetical protein VFP10_11300, partial [Candidatus Eisenbacteria bacterium]|nr:hypothetical protein [Candidatus Eisenbacteria bacterium]
YPDDPPVLEQVERMLEGFDERSDLRRLAAKLLDTGIAGTDLYYSFYWPMARWLADRWPDRITVDWEMFEKSDRLKELLSLLVAYSETPALDLEDFSTEAWLKRLKGRDETDAAFLVRRFERLEANGFLKEALYDSLDPFFKLSPGPGTPSRTRAKVPVKRIHFQTRVLDRARPDLHKAIAEAPRSVRHVSQREGRQYVDLAREAMVTRSRDLDAFSQADPRDVFLVDYGDGLQFAGMGMVPERRLLLESVYGFVTLRNGVPIGYVLSSALVRSSEVAYNVFETYRGGESAIVFGRVMSMIHHLFGSTAFALDPYQLGYGNEEGLESGAWWFYYKMGFRPVNATVRRVLRTELQRMAKDRAHRSDRATLETLASEYTFFHLGSARRDVLGRMDLGAIGLAVSGLLAEKFGSRREEGIAWCVEEAARLLNVGSFRGWTQDERLAWERWSPLVLVLPGLPRWSQAEHRGLVEVIRMKGGRSEMAFVQKANQHGPLHDALVALASGRKISRKSEQ